RGGPARRRRARAARRGPARALPAHPGPLVRPPHVRGHGRGGRRGRHGRPPHHPHPLTTPPPDPGGPTPRGPVRSTIRREVDRSPGRPRVRRSTSAVGVRWVRGVGWVAVGWGGRHAGARATPGGAAHLPSGRGPGRTRAARRGRALDRVPGAAPAAVPPGAARVPRRGPLLGGAPGPPGGARGRRDGPGDGSRRAPTRGIGAGAHPPGWAARRRRAHEPTARST